MGFLSRVRLPLLAAALLCLVCAGEAGLCAGERLAASGDQLCALFVQRLARYVDWPPGTGPGDGPLNVAATDARGIRPAFAEIAGDPAVQVAQWPVPACHILLLNGTPPREAAAIVQALADRPVLIVGFGLEAPPPGLAVNLRESDGRLRMEINPAAARKAGLALSSRLLQIAVVIHEP